MRVPKVSMQKGMICDLEDLQLSEENPSEEALQNRDNYAKVALMLFYPFRNNSIFSLEKDGCLWDKMTRLMMTETEQNNFFREGKIILQNMQDNMQARKCKIPTERLKKCTVSTQNDENQHQDRMYDSDDQYSDFEDAESVEAYDDNELDQDDYNDEMDDARNLNDLK
jgi:hypothetical protein